MEAMKRGIRRDGYNRGVRAAAKIAKEQGGVWNGPILSAAILTLLKPTKDYPILRVKYP